MPGNTTSLALAYERRLRTFMLIYVSLLAVMVLAVLHIFAGRLRFLDVTPRSIWLSIGGGVSIAYIFVHLLPELSEGQEAVADAAGEALAFLEHQVYLVALLGLAIFYGLERAAKRSRQRRRQQGEGDRTSGAVFWLHIASFAAYNSLIGYLLIHRDEDGLWGLILFALAMAVHFVVNDHGLREHHKAAYHRVGRWVLAMAILAGWGIGLLTELPEAALVVLLAFLAGGVILNVLKEELPEERQKPLLGLRRGATAYAALLLLI